MIYYYIYNIEKDKFILEFNYDIIGHVIIKYSESPGSIFSLESIIHYMNMDSNLMGDIKKFVIIEYKWYANLDWEEEWEYLVID